MNRTTFEGFVCGSGFYARIRGKDDRVRVRTYTDPQDAVTFVATSVGRSPNMMARFTDGSTFGILDGAGRIIPGALPFLRRLLNEDEGALLRLFGAL